MKLNRNKMLVFIIALLSIANIIRNVECSYRMCGLIFLL